MKRLAWLALLWLLPALAQAAQVQATLDRNQVQLGETVTLNLQVEGGAIPTAPDLSALAPDFDVLGSSSNTRLGIVNGRRSLQFTYGVALRPKRVGQLTIPALAFAGAWTVPLTLTVTAADPSVAAHRGENVFLEASAQPTQVHVGQQVLFTVRLYFAGSLARGELDDPQLPGVDARRLGSDLDYEVVRDGRAYHVIERRYALMPQRAGRLQLPSLQFRGELIDPTDPDSFFSMGAPTTAASPALAIDVQPVPPDWGDSAWLPARALTLTLEGLPADGKLRVGQPLDLTMTVQATGLPYEVLPTLSLPAPEGATVYPDKPVAGTRDDGQWLLGRRQQHFALVPSRAGPLTLPAITLKWWNVQTGRAEEARIPSRVLTALPAAGTGTPEAPASSAMPVRSTAVPAAAVSAPPPARWTLAPWWWIAAAAVALVLMAGALLAWWWRRVRTADPHAARAASARALRATFLALAHGNDAAAQAQALLAWARAERPGLTNLGAVAAALASQAQREAIDRLQQRRYAPGGSAPVSGLREAFARGLQWRAPPADESSPLPPLYPFKLR
jgi:hypothetical protein